MKYNLHNEVWYDYIQNPLLIPSTSIWRWWLGGGRAKLTPNYVKVYYRLPKLHHVQNRLWQLWIIQSWRWGGGIFMRHPVYLFYLSSVERQHFVLSVSNLHLSPLFIMEHQVDQSLSGSDINYALAEPKSPYQLWNLFIN